MGRKLLVLPREVSQTCASTDNNRCEKSAEVIVDTDTSLVKGEKKQEVSPSIEGLNLIKVNNKRLPNERQKAENIAR